MFEKLLPETLFPRKLRPPTERRLRLAQARAEEALVRTHVESALNFVEALADELTFDRAIDSYIRVMGIPEPLASVIVTRALVMLGEELLPARRTADSPSDDLRPKLRLADDEPDRSRAPLRAMSGGATPTPERGGRASRAD